MSLRGYKPKTKPAMWRSVHPVAAPEPKPIIYGLRVVRKKNGDLVWKDNERPRKRIKPVSAAMAKKKAVYRPLAKEFVATERRAGKTCPVVAAIPELRNGRRYGHQISNKLNEVHHFYGRLGRLLLAQWGWHARSKQGHRWIHENIAEARKLDFICQPGLWNNYEAAKADAIKRGWLVE